MIDACSDCLNRLETRNYLQLQAPLYLYQGKLEFSPLPPMFSSAMMYVRVPIGYAAELPVEEVYVLLKIWPQMCNALTTRNCKSR